MADKVSIDSAIPLIFNDAAKTISDLKSRQWTATTLSAAGVIGIVSFDQKSGSMTPKPAWLLVGFIVLILVGYTLVMWRCATNISKFRDRLRRVVEERFTSEAKIFFEEQYGGLVTDEGTIIGVAIFLVVMASVFAVLAVV